MSPFFKTVAKTFAALSVAVGILAGLATVIGAFAGQPDIVIDFLAKGIELMDKLIALADRCLEQCFE